MTAHLISEILVCGCGHRWDLPEGAHSWMVTGKPRPEIKCPKCGADRRNLRLETEKR